MTQCYGMERSEEQAAGAIYMFFTCNLIYFVYFNMDSLFGQDVLTILANMLWR